MIMIFIVLYAMEAEHVTDFFANWIISRKALRGRPWLFSFMILLGDALLSIISPEAAMLLFWEIIFATCDTVNLKRTGPWSVAMIFGTCFASGCGIILLPFMRNGFVVCNQFAAMSGGETMDALRYIIAMIPLGIAGITIYTLLCKFIFRIDTGDLKNVDDSVVNKEMLILNKRQKFVMCVVALMIIVLLVPSILPAGIVKKVLNDLNLLGISFSKAVILCNSIVFTILIVNTNPHPGSRMGYLRKGGVYIILINLVIAEIWGLQKSQYYQGLPGLALRWKDAEKVYDLTNLGIVELLGRGGVTFWGGK